MGNTFKDPEAFASLIHDVETKVFDALPDETWVYPGHGNDTTLGAERLTPAGMAGARLVTGGLLGRGPAPSPLCTRPV
ncbi:hypothetical protein SALBM311S_11120 [Streptomyces alboniger]